MKALGRIKHLNGMVTAGSTTLQEQESHKVFVLTDIKNIGVSVDFLMKIGERGTDTAVFSLCITQYWSISTRSLDIMDLSGSVGILMLISSQIPAMHDFRKFSHLERNFQFHQNSSKNSNARWLTLHHSPLQFLTSSSGGGRRCQGTVKH